jgi:hypothetical protein
MGGKKSKHEQLEQPPAPGKSDEEILHKNETPSSPAMYESSKSKFKLSKAI